ncbi:Hypothetical protein P9303_20171 [Prochlorococcus marinus str. MIT 9303]|uniref:Carbamoyltransferase C-terminal domain-containing protein n=2 Tax=Prochlorococcus marinus TaxID=1219 RepID=A2CB99_PROM3|nr:Hypothetical protein P9303_20171 [Prochlorococcus marinus str. MIT 9303]
MNVKANQKILSSDLVNSLVVPGAPDDQSNSIGACLLYQSIQDGKLPSNLTDNMYLGEGIEPIDESDIKRFCDKESVHIVKTITPGQVADILISGEIVARASGNMEFGARALGNRSIFALPSDWDSVDRINYLIKQRDFWMPFAGSVIEEDANFILEGDWKKGDARFMTISFPAKLEHYHKFKAATHRKDKSIRIHVVLKEENPWYYEMLLSIKKRLGLGVILNTSFNLHGYPIVRTKQDALEIFYATNIKHLVLGDSLLSKLNPISQ